MITRALMATFLVYFSIMIYLRKIYLLWISSLQVEVC